MRDRISSRGMTPASSSRPWWTEMVQNKIIALVIAMLVAVPLLAAPADRNLTGIAALTLETFAVVLLTALLWRGQWDLRAENVRRFLKTSANLPILLLMALVAVSCAFSPDKVLSCQEMLRIGSGVLLYFVAAYQFRQSKHLSLLAGTILFLGTIVAFGGMAQYQLLGQERARGFFGDPQPLGSFVMLLLPIVGALAWTDKNPRRRIVAQVSTVLMVGCLLLTQGRSAWLGGIAGAMALVWLATRALPGQEKTSFSFKANKAMLVWPVMFVLVAGGFLFAMKSQNDSISNRATTVSQLSSDMSWQKRIQHNWKGAVQMIEAKPLTGWGLGLFPLYQYKYTGEGMALSVNGANPRISLAEQAHNFYLQTAAELGLPGLFLTLAMLGSFLVAGFKRFGSMEAGIRRTLLMGSLAATVGFMVDAVGSPSWQYGQNSMFFWLVVGIGTSCLRPRPKREVEVAPVHAATRRINLIGRPAAVATALFLATLLPASYSAAQSSCYNGSGDCGGGGNDTGAIIGGAALLGFLASLSGGGAAGGSVFIPVADKTPTPTPTPGGPVSTSLDAKDGQFMPVGNTAPASQ